MTIFGTRLRNIYPNAAVEGSTKTIA